MKTETKKITLATFKSFVKRNRDNLFISVKSSFNGMTDSVEQLKGSIHPIEKSELKEENTLGIRGVWLVLRGRDYFTAHEGELYKGIEVYNACGCFIIGIIK